MSVCGNVLYLWCIFGENQATFNDPIKGKGTVSQNYENGRDFKCRKKLWDTKIKGIKVSDQAEIVTCAEIRGLDEHEVVNGCNIVSSCNDKVKDDMRAQGIMGVWGRESKE